MNNDSIAVIGAGWAGAVAARLLFDGGFRVELFEREHVIGGHSRTAKLNGVIFEPSGPHIFHTSSRRIASFVHKFGMWRQFEHKVFTEIFLDPDDQEPFILSWPPQLEEIRELPIWPRIEHELSNLPEKPSVENLETYCESTMGRTLYELFVREYSVKQWGREPSELSSAFGIKRFGLRTDGNRRMFRDTWEFFHPRGSEEIIERIARPVPVTAGCEMTLSDLDSLGQEFQAIVLSVPLDDFAGKPGELEWRGIRTVSRYMPMPDPHGTMTPAYVVNRPSARRAYTRTVETKHATGQKVRGTVVTEEYPGSADRHYPVHTSDSRNERKNRQLQRAIRDSSPVPVFFCGRLANYQYINQDEAIGQAMNCANEVASLWGR